MRVRDHAQCSCFQSCALSFKSHTIIFIYHRHLPRVVILCACRCFFFFFTLWGPTETPPGVCSACPPSELQPVCTIGTNATEEKQVFFKQDFKMFIPIWYPSIGSRDIPSQWFSNFSEYHYSCDNFQPVTNQYLVTWFKNIFCYAGWKPLNMPITINKLSGLNVFIYALISLVEGIWPYNVHQIISFCPRATIGCPTCLSTYVFAHLHVPCLCRHDTSSAHCRQSKNERHYYCNIMHFVL